MPSTINTTNNVRPRDMRFRDNKRIPLRRRVKRVYSNIRKKFSRNLTATTT